MKGKILKDKSNRNINSQKTKRRYKLWSEIERSVKKFLMLLFFIGGFCVQNSSYNYKG